MCSSSKFTDIKVLDDSIDLSGFDCSKEDDLKLNDFIHKQALDYQKKGMGVTYLFYVGDKIVGYATVAMSHITTRYLDKAFRVKLGEDPDTVFPALKLGRLAVANSERYKEYGSEIIQYFVAFAKKKAVREVGCMFIVLVTIQKRVKFYVDNKFRMSNKQVYNSKTGQRDDLYRMMYLQLFERS